MLLLIGSSPSSGSTLLADLFDAIPGFCCGPESRFFCYEELYTHFSDYQKRLHQRFAFSIPSLQNVRGTFSNKERVLSAYGFTKSQFIQQARASNDSRQFIDRLKQQYFRSRNDSINEVWVEKYPENIFVAASFLESFPEAHFIQVVRDPVYVYNSLRKNRSFAPAMAIATWLLANAAGYALKDHPRMNTIMYQDLVKNPFELIGKTAGKITGKSYDDEVIRANYERNNYRKNTEYRHKEWTAATYGVIKNANDVKISDEILEEYHSFGGLKISKGYRELFNLPDVSIDEICKYYGFQPPETKFTNKTDLASMQKFFVKFVLDYVYGTAKLSNLKHYINPINS